jgi:hypothetical protein
MRKLAILSRAICTLLLVTGLAARASDDAVSVKVRERNGLCAASGREVSCAEIVSLLREKLALPLERTIHVMTEGVGESALARGQRVADSIKAAGFRTVVLVGFLSLPEKLPNKSLERTRAK